MRRVIVDHVTDSGMHYGTLEYRRSRRNKRTGETERFIDNAMTAILTGWIFLLLWYGASVVLPGILR